MKFLNKFGYLVLVLKDIKSRKFSSILTLLAISFGILSIFCILNIGESFENSVKEEFEKAGTNKILISPKKEYLDKFDDNLIKDLKKEKRIDGVFPSSSERLFVKQKINAREKDQKLITVAGFDFSEEIFESFSLKTQNNEKVNSNNKFGVYIGSFVSERYFDDKIKKKSNLYIGDTKFKVIGILEEIGSRDADSQIYIQRDIYEKITKNEFYKDIVIKVDTDYDTKKKKEEIIKFLKDKFDEDEIEVFVDVSTFEQILSQFESTFSIIKSFFLGVAIISLLVGFFGIINTMNVIITSKIKDIGIMKSIGATNKDIIILFSFFSGFYGLLGSLVGIILGSIILIFIRNLGDLIGIGFLVIKINPITILYMLIFGFLVGVIAGFLPARKASKLDIVNALRK